MNIHQLNAIKPFVAVPYRAISNITNTNPQIIIKNVIGFIAYIKDWIAYSRTVTHESNFRPHFASFLRYQTLLDRYENAGVAEGDYFHQDLWFAKKIFLANPARHWDIGSRVDGFISHLLVFRSVDVEGHEMSVLEGLGSYLLGDFVDFIQFEYGGNNLDSRTSLMELYELLEKAGFYVAKVMYRGLEIREYQVWMENFQYANYVAISKKIVDKLK